MARFLLNRRWTFVLALGVSLVWCSAALGPGSAFGSIGYLTDGNSGGGNAGDPDLPSGPGKNRPAGARPQSNVSPEMRAAGDSKALGSAGMLRLRVVLSSLRSLFIRF